MSEEIAGDETLLLDKLLTSAPRVFSRGTARETYSAIIKSAIQLLNGKDGAIALDKSGELEIVHGTSTVMRSLVLKPEDTAYASFNSQEIVSIKIADYKDQHARVDDSEVNSVVFIPFHFDQKPLGVILVRYYRSDELSDLETKYIKLLSEMATASIKQLQLDYEYKLVQSYRDIFISMIVHELRTPLTIIGGYTDRLKSQKDNLNEKAQKWVTQLNLESRKLTGLITELVEINRINTGKSQYVFEECNLSDLMHESLQSFTLLYPERKIEFTSVERKKTSIIGDRTKISQMLSSVMDYVVEHSSAVAITRIDLNCTYKRCIIKIDVSLNELSSDPVISKALQTSISSTPLEDIGIALFLAKTIVKQHRGDIKHNFSPGGDIHIEIELPTM